MYWAVSAGQPLYPDEVYYETYARQILDAGLPPVEVMAMLTDKVNAGYVLINAAFQKVGMGRLALVLFNAIVSATAVFPAWRLGQRVGLRGQALRWYVWSLSLYPDLIHWSAFNLKEGILLPLVLFTLHESVLLAERSVTVARALKLVAGLAVLYTLRFYVAAIIGVVLAGILLVRSSLPGIVKLGIASIAVLLGGRSVAPLVVELQDASIANVVAAGASLGAVVSGNFAVDLLLAVGHFLLTPSPLNWSSRTPFLVVGTLVWWWLLPMGMVGILRWQNRQSIGRLFLTGCAVALIAAMGIAPFLADARHRLLVVPIFLLFAMERAMRLKSMAIPVGILLAFLSGVIVLLIHVVLLA